MPDGVTETGVLTTIHLVIIAILAILTVIGIVVGIRRARKRREAVEVEQARLAREAPAEKHETEPTLVEEREVTPTPPPVVTPAPPTPTERPAAPPSPAEPVETETTPLDNEPIAASAPNEAALAAEASAAVASDAADEPAPTAQTPEPAPAASDADGPVTQLKGVGPKVAVRLAELGVTTIGDMAALDAAAAESIDARLGPFTGRLARDRWIEQARFLTAGDRAGFEAVFGKL